MLHYRRRGAPFLPRRPSIRADGRAAREAVSGTDMVLGGLQRVAGLFLAITKFATSMDVLCEAYAPSIDILKIQMLRDHVATQAELLQVLVQG